MSEHVAEKMSSGGYLSFIRIELLTKDNYDTWRMHMEALLVKNNAWGYVSGTITRPTIAAEIPAWVEGDQKARSDLILSISGPELKLIRGCSTSREVWLRLEEVYASTGPARKATLLKHLMLYRMEEGGDVREHLSKFFDVVDKLEAMDVEINKELLSIMLLYSLPSSFDNFRCVMESRDTVPTPDTLRIKITEESDARRQPLG